MTVDPLRPVDREVQKDGTVKARSALSPESFKTRAEVLVPSRKVIPVILVPGVMGSNLKVKAGREIPVRTAYRKADMEYTPKTWTPNEGVSMLMRMSFYPPALRQVILNKDNVEVDGEGMVDVTGLPLSAQEARARGWGEVMWEGAYGQLLRSLECDLSRFMYPPGPGATQPKLSSWWNEMHHAGQVIPGDPYGNRTPVKSRIPASFRLTLEDIKKAGAFRFPVHACGYNWLQSNADSAKRLKGKIEAVIRKYAEAKGPDGKPAFECRHVILVTHSMGGFVARMASKLLKNEGHEDKILGIVHGEMPALGAPVMYRRMACGFESDGSIGGLGFACIAGSTTSKANPVLAFSPAALELAPTPDYPGPWLLAEIAENQTSRHVLGLPAHGDPYGEIFLAKGKWYCPVVEWMLDPAKLHVNKFGKNSSWEDYVKIVTEAQLFHCGAKADFKKQDEKERFLGNYYHPKTYIHYGENEKIDTLNHVHWRSELLYEKPFNNGGASRFYQSANLKNTNGKNIRGVELDVLESWSLGQIEAERKVAKTNGHPLVIPKIVQEFRCHHKNRKGISNRGDGTVPDVSGAFPSRHGVKQIYILSGFDHQGAYENAVVRGATFFAIVDMVKRL